MREPWFWRAKTPTARALTGLLTPAAWIYQAGHRLRWATTKPKKARLPVICVGNATLGGAGKTPFAILVATLFKEAGVKPVFLTRGYGGERAGPIKVDPARHTAFSVGDEALLLARHGPAIVAHDRQAGAKLAAKTGAQVIVMDDGFQNPTLAKDFSILLVGEEEAQTNGALFPAGPYRESPASARARADLVVAMGPGPSHPPEGADMAAWVEAEKAHAPERVIAFAGIGRPEKFFRTLKENGFTLVRRIAFPDHHSFSNLELEHLMKIAEQHEARLICTEKDHVRLPSGFREKIFSLPVAMQVSDRQALKQRLLGLIKDAGEEHEPS